MQKTYYVLIFLLAGGIVLAQKKEAKTTLTFDEKLYSALEWRSIGPYRGGRSAAVTGVPGKPNLFYMGATGGGVWRTNDAGNTWTNISDGFFGSSIGSVAVSEWDNNVIYVGQGEGTIRGNVSYGHGMWKSTDAGKTWTFVGLKESKHIPRIRIHPKNPDLVYAAVLGDLFKSSEERGVYRSDDGGKNWKRILFANANAGAVDLCMDPNNPRILYASMWRARRTPYSMESGGEGSAIYKSTDGGETWKNISTNDGLPKGIWGISCVSVSPVNSNRVYAMIENDNGGVYRSDDAGQTWKKMNEDRNLRQRAWYYTKIYADTKDEDMLYVMNVSYHKSKDGGKTFQSYNAPHGDHHDLWIAPEDNQRMVIADDGGAQVSFDAGENWSTYGNQPTAQYYRVTTDNHFPYRIYGAQQDNSTQRVAHRTDGFSIGDRDWEPTAGGESGHIAIDPTDNDVVFGGSYDGLLTRKNHRTGEERGINAWPDNPMGHGAEGAKYRFQWNFPIFFSPHDTKKLYAASQNLHVSYNAGESWELASPDLTRNDASKMGSSGGPITKDNTSVEYYCTIFAVAESPYEKDLILAGSDDGLLHITRDGGKNWTKLSVAGMPEWTMINSVEFTPHEKGAAYVAATSYKSGDYRPLLFKTKDYGKTWTKITDGIDPTHFTRVVRADQKRSGLLYAGTEFGMYISFDDGTSWKPFQLNLPIVPINDLTIKNDNLIAATQGRSFWLIDDLTPLHQLNDVISKSDTHLFKPMPSYRMNGGQAGRRGQPKNEGVNHPNGVMIHYFVKDTTKLVASLEILESSGKLIKKFATKPDKKAKEKEDELKLKPGMNRQVWNMRYADAEGFDGLIMWAASLTGPKAMPGMYKARLIVNGKAMETEFEILKDPRTSGTLADIKAQFDFSIAVRDKLSETNKAVKKIRTAREQINRVTEPMKGKEDMKDVNDMAKSILDDMKKIEETLYQTKNKSGQDPLNYPVRLNNKLGALGSEVDGSDFRPTEQVKAVYKEITEKIDEQLNLLNKVMTDKVPKFNDLVKQKQVNAISIGDIM
ncbi:MAG: glycosyl hydrolase [Cytophagales bacterium]|nr:glycosyl hydrolase [Cytophagales bacterium]MCA6387455.1 glycosyl hydrolase [Cytophagales bacterium]MCA6393139.1 glycosyl hydrolase [Cytophagales bacterium]MCA6397349.1 glycosyl hydrolase [Cytophagales bacterium]MCA6403439.1 glycosyl hydrolase [Cytophagales bacterium]